MTDNLYSNYPEPVRLAGKQIVVSTPSSQYLEFIRVEYLTPAIESPVHTLNTMAPIDQSKMLPSYDTNFAHFPSRRSTVFSSRGAIATSQPLGE